MAIRHLVNESDILNLDFRKQVIVEIEGSENIRRKKEGLKRYEVYKDLVKKWVIEELSREFSGETVLLMEARATNLSILKKVVNKIASTYDGIIERTLAKDSETASAKALAENVDLNSIMQRKDRYLTLFKNTLTHIVPVMDTADVDLAASAFQFRITLRELNPDQWDAIPDQSNPEVPRAIILSEFTQRNQLYQAMPGGGDGRLLGTPVGDMRTTGDLQDQAIANSPQDAGTNKKEYIWWSNHFHFTTDCEGEIIPSKSPDGNENPIGIMPFAHSAEGQDGYFWALGGDDLLHGALHVNKLLTDMYTIASVQGWGQPVAKGKDLPKVIQGGPHRLLTLNYDTGDPVPSFEYVSSQPPIGDWMQMIEQFLALFLSTNDLSPTSVAGKLEGNKFPSGLADMVDQSKYTGDREYRKKQLKKAETQVFRVLQRWHSYLQAKKALVEDQAEIPVFEDYQVNVNYTDPDPVLSEQDELAILKTRKDLGLNTDVELIMRDRDISDETEAEKVLMKIIEERAKYAVQTQVVDPNSPDGSKLDAPAATNTDNSLSAERALPVIPLGGGQDAGTKAPPPPAKG